MCVCVQGRPWLNWGPKQNFILKAPPITKLLCHEMPFRFTTFINRNKSNEQPLSTMEVKSDTTLKSTNSTRSTSDKCAGHRAVSTGCALGVVIASVDKEMLPDGPGDMLGAGSVSRLVTNCSIDDVIHHTSRLLRFVLVLMVNYTMK